MVIALVEGHSRDIFGVYGSPVTSGLFHAFMSFIDSYRSEAFLYLGSKGVKGVEGLGKGKDWGRGGGGRRGSGTGVKWCGIFFNLGLYTMADFLSCL